VLANWVNRTKLFQDMRIKTAMKTQTTKPARGGIPRTRPAAPSRIQSILVPIDFSAPSKSALAYAVPLAEQLGAKITLINVVEPVATPDFATSFPLVMENSAILEESRHELERVVNKAGISPKLIGQSLVRCGRSYHEIADAAHTLKVDLIIMATHGYTGLKHALLGSTAERVVRHAPCPVLVVRDRK
jgi:universal stress protein A